MENMWGKKLKKLLGIPEDEKIVSLESYEKGGKVYYRIRTYASGGTRDYHVPRKLESEVLSLWNRYSKILERRKVLSEFLWRAADRARSEGELVKLLCETFIPSSRRGRR